MILLGILFSIVVDVKANIFPDTFNFFGGNHHLGLCFRGVQTCFVIIPVMSQFKGKELIRRLAWLVYQDQEHYRYQLEKAVSIPLEF